MDKLKRYDLVGMYALYMDEVEDGDYFHVDDVLPYIAEHLTAVQNKAELCDKAYQYVCQLLDERNIPRWVPVSERLPDEEAVFDVWDSLGSRLTDIEIISGEFYDVCYDEPLDATVTHWMPLPPPPTQEEGQ